MAVQPSCTIIPLSFSISSSSRSLILRAISPGWMFQMVLPRTTSTPSTASILRRSRLRSASRSAAIWACSACCCAFLASRISTRPSAACWFRACLCSSAIWRLSAPPVMALATERTALVNIPLLGCGDCVVGACGITGRCGCIGRCGITGAWGRTGCGAWGCWGAWGCKLTGCPHLVQNFIPGCSVAPHFLQYVIIVIIFKVMGLTYEFRIRNKREQ